MDRRLLEMLVCPLCKSSLHLVRNDGGLPHELICLPDRLAFPIRDDIAVMLETEARSLGTEEAEALAATRKAQGAPSA
jgi:uncharacterized protein